MGTSYRKYLAPLLAISAIAFFTLMAGRSEGTYYGGDSYWHYYFSKYAFQFPVFYLDHWAKPFFTLVSSPFSQFGYKGIIFFNILCGTAAGYMAFLTAKKNAFRYPEMALVFILFTPIFMKMMFTGMTEIFFTFLLTAGFYFLIDKKYVLSAVLLSFLPYVRNEGIIFLFLFSLFFIYKRKFIPVLVLATGTIIYSFAGGIYFRDILWLIHKSPYQLSGDVYGHGELSFYYKALTLCLGDFLKILVYIGLIITLVSLINFFRKRQMLLKNQAQNMIFVILVPVLYFSFQSIIWWKGWMSVLGDYRFLTAIVPFTSIIALFGFEKICGWLKVRAIAVYGLIVVVSVLVIYQTLLANPLPVPLMDENIVVRYTVDWIKRNRYNQSVIYYFNPYIPLALDASPFNNQKLREGIKNPETIEKTVPPGSILIWDSHFSANEALLPLSRVLNSKSFRLLRVFRPVVPFTVIGNNDYKVCVFQRIKEMHNE